MILKKNQPSTQNNPVDKQLMSDDNSVRFTIISFYQPLKRQEKMHLKMSSAANNCLTLLTNSSMEANRVDPDQTAPIGAV